VFKLGVGNDLGTVLGFKGQSSRSQGKFILHIRTLYTRTAIHRHSLGDVTNRLRFCGCLVRASLTFARWGYQSSVLVRKIWIECLLVVHVAWNDDWRKKIKKILILLGTAKHLRVAVLRTTSASRSWKHNSKKPSTSRKTRTANTTRWANVSIRFPVNKDSTQYHVK